MSIINMKQSDIKILREKLWLKNNKICPLLKIEIPLEKVALDHIHKLKGEQASKQKGVVRDSIEFRANAIEGKITNFWKRNFGSDESKHPISLPDFLRNLADYLEKGAYKDKDNNYYLHPTEVPKEPKLKKSSYNKLKKVLDEKDLKKLSEYPKSKKLLKSLVVLYIKYDIKPEFY